MGLFDVLESAASSIVNTAEDVVGGAVNTVEGVAGGAVNLAGDVVGGAFNLAGGVLNGVEGIVSPLLGGILGPLLGGKIPLPFSGISSAMANPAQFAGNLASASASINDGLDLSGIGKLEADANAAQQKAASSGSVQDAIAAQEASEKLNQVASLITTALSEKSNLADKIASNMRTQG